MLKKNDMKSLYESIYPAIAKAITKVLNEQKLHEDVNKKIYSNTYITLFLRAVIYYKFPWVIKGDLYDELTSLGKVFKATDKNFAYTVRLVAEAFGEDVPIDWMDLSIVSRSLQKKYITFVDGTPYPRAPKYIKWDKESHKPNDLGKWNEANATKVTWNNTDNHKEYTWRTAEDWEKCEEKPLADLFAEWEEKNKMPVDCKNWEKCKGKPLADEWKEKNKLPTDLKGWDIDYEKLNMSQSMINLWKERDAAHKEEVKNAMKKINRYIQRHKI